MKFPSGKRLDGNDTAGEFMKRAFCRPYGTDPGVHIISPSSKLLGYYQLSLRDKENIDLNSLTVSGMSRLSANGPLWWMHLCA